MTIDELEQLRYLNTETAGYKDRLAELRAMAEGTTAGKISGLPHGFGVSDKVGSGAVRIVELELSITLSILKCEREYERLDNYIQGIEDSLMRQILTYRFIDGLSWLQVAMCIGCGNTGDGVRMACKRFIQSN